MFPSSGGDAASFATHARKDFVMALIWNRRPVKLSAVAAAAAIVAACGGDGDGPFSPQTQPIEPPPPPPTVACSVDTSVELAYEEKRLDTPLPFSGANVVGTDQTPVSERLVKGAGFEQFAPDFAARLCDADGKTEITTYEQALDAVKAEGSTLWKTMIDRVQGRRVSGTLPASDDRPLYWTRVQMTKVLRQWKPDFAMTAAQREELQWELERSSRGQHDINLPAGNNADGKKYRRMIISGFDTYSLPVPGSTNTNMRNGNPSGATAVALDGMEFELQDGSILHIESYVLPVSYDPFNKGMQEDTLGPFFREGPQRVDASVSISQGSANVYNLEQWNGRFHGPTVGNDGISYCPNGGTPMLGAPDRLPNIVLPIGRQTVPATQATLPAPITMANSGCDIYPQERWLGYNSNPTGDSTGWQKDWPPQFNTASLPMAAMVTGNTQAGVVRPPGATSLGTEGFNVTQHTNYTYFANCNLPQTTSVQSNGFMNVMPNNNSVVAPLTTVFSQSGGGGNYLSNESAYRNVLLRDVFGLDIPAGHIHVPVMTNFFGNGGTPGARDDNAITDARFEAYRTAIVQQTRNLLVVVGNSLTLK
jgi:hypothetical protein